MTSKMLQTYFLLVLIALSLFITFLIFKPFLIILILAGVFAVVLQPPYRFILRSMDNSPGLAAFVTMLLTVACIVIPLAFITIQITSDAQHLYTSLSDGSARTYLSTISRYADGIASQYVPGLAFSETEISTTIDRYTKDGLTWIIQNLGNAFGGAARLFLALFIFLIALYYLLRDGTRLKKVIIVASPLADADDQIVLSRLELAVHSVIRGSLMIALIQGTLTGIGFAVAGIPNSVLWGVVAAFSALIPGIGTSLVLIPGVAYLFIIGAAVPAFGLLLWSIFAVGLIDNFLGPKLVGRGMQLHPLVVLLSVFGGLAFFGPAGVFLGPLCTSLLFALLSIYERASKQSA